MDRLVRAKFFQVENAVRGQATFYECLQQLWGHRLRSEYQDVGGGTNVRIEHFREPPEIEGVDYVAGEFVRQQTDNIPPVAHAGQPLVQNQSPLGHRAAFRYRLDRSVLLLETRQGAVSTTRINSLIRRRVPQHSGFLFAPALTEDALSRLQAGTPRRFTMKVARPAEMALGEVDGFGLEDNLANLQNLFNGPMIEITAGWPRGERGGMLSIANLIRSYHWAVGRRGNVQKFEVKLAEEDVPMDMFAEQMKIEDTLELSSENVMANYLVRETFLAGGFDGHFDEIVRVYDRP